MNACPGIPSVRSRSCLFPPEAQVQFDPLTTKQNGITPVTTELSLTLHQNRESRHPIEGAQPLSLLEDLTISSLRCSCSSVVSKSAHGMGFRLVTIRSSTSRSSGSTRSQGLSGSSSS